MQPLVILRLLALVLATVTLRSAGVEAPKISPEWLTPALDAMLTPVGKRELEEARARGPGQDAVLVLYEVIHRVDDQAGAETLFHLVLHARTEAGVGQVREQSHSHSRLVQDLRLVRATVHQPDGTRQQAHDADLIAHTPQYDAEQSVYNDQQELRVVLPGVRAGSVVDVVWLRRQAKPLVPGTFLAEMPFTPDPFSPARTRLVVDLPSPLAARLKEGWAAGEGPKRVSLKTDRKRQRFEWAQGPSSTPAPPGGEVDLAREWPRLSLTTASGWDDIAAWFNALTLPRGKPGPEVKAAAAALAPAQAPAPVVLRAALQRVSRDVRYTGFEFGVGSHQPHDCNEVWRRQFGDCKDKSNLLRVLLAERGIRSWMVLVESGPATGPGRNGVPTPWAFNHALLAVDDGAGGLVYCDPVHTHLPPGVAPGEWGDRDALLVRADRAEWVRLPAAAPARVEDEYELTWEADGALHGWREIRWSGQAAPRKAAEMALCSEGDRLEFHKQLAEEDWPDSLRLDALPDRFDPTNLVFATRYYFLRAPAAAPSGSPAPLTLPVAANLASILGANRERATPFRSARAQHHLLIRLRLPAGMRAGISPNSFQRDLPDARFRGSVTGSGRMVVLSASVEFVEDRIPVPRFPPVWDGLAALVKWGTFPVDARMDDSSPPPRADPPDPPRLPTVQGQWEFIHNRWGAASADPARLRAMQRLIEWFPSPENDLLQSIFELSRVEQDRSAAVRKIDALLDARGASLPPTVRGVAYLVSAEMHYLLGAMETSAARASAGLEKEGVAPLYRGMLLYYLARSRLAVAPAEAMANYAKAADAFGQHSICASWVVDAAQVGSRKDLEAALNRVAALPLKELALCFEHARSELASKDSDGMRRLRDTMSILPGPPDIEIASFWRAYCHIFGSTLNPEGEELVFLQRLSGLLDRLELPGKPKRWSAPDDPAALRKEVGEMRDFNPPAGPDHLWKLLSAAFRPQVDAETLGFLNRVPDLLVQLLRENPGAGPECLRLLDALALAPARTSLRGMAEHGRILGLATLQRFDEASRALESALADPLLAKWHTEVLLHAQSMLICQSGNTAPLAGWMVAAEPYLQLDTRLIDTYLIGIYKNIKAGNLDAAMDHLTRLAARERPDSGVPSQLPQGWFDSVRHAVGHPRETLEFWKAGQEAEANLEALKLNHQSGASLFENLVSMRPDSLSSELGLVTQATHPATTQDLVHFVSRHFPLARVFPDQALRLATAIHTLSESQSGPDGLALLTPLADALVLRQATYPEGEEPVPGLGLATRVSRAVRLLDVDAVEESLVKWLALSDTDSLRPATREFLQAVRRLPQARERLRARLTAALESGKPTPAARAAQVVVLAHILLFENKPAAALARLNLELRDPRLEQEEPYLVKLQEQARYGATTDTAVAAAEAEQCSAWFEAHGPKWTFPGLPTRLLLMDGQEWAEPPPNKAASHLWWHILSMKDPRKSGSQRWASAGLVLSSHLAILLPRTERRRWASAWFLDSHPLPDVVREAAAHSIVDWSIRQWDPELPDLLADHPSTWFSPDLRRQLRQCASDLRAPPSEADMRARLPRIADNTASRNSRLELLLLFDRSLRLGLFDLAETWRQEIGRFEAADARHHLYGSGDEYSKRLLQARANKRWMDVARNWQALLPDGNPAAAPAWLAEYAIADTSCVLLPAEHRREYIHWQARGAGLVAYDATTWMHWLAAVDLSELGKAQFRPVREMIRACEDPRLRLVLLLALRDPVDLGDSAGREAFRQDLDAIAGTCADGATRQALFLLRLRLALRSGEPLSLEPLPPSGLPVETTTDPAAQVERFDLLLADAVSRNDPARLREIFTELAAHPMQNSVNPATLSAGLIRLGDSGGLTHFQSIWRNTLPQTCMEVMAYKLPESCARLAALLRALNGLKPDDGFWQEALERTPWPAHRDAYELRLTLHTLRREWPKVESVARQAIAQHPRYPVFLWNLAESLIEQGRELEARPFLDNFIQRGAGCIDLRRAHGLRLLLPPAVPPGAGAHGVGE